MNSEVLDTYPKYDNYKDSGVDWLGKIPEEWDLVPAFKFISENKIKNTGLVEDIVLSLSFGQIVIKPKEKLTGLVPESFEGYQIVKPNNIIIRCTDLQNDKNSLRIGLVKNDGIITSAYLGLKVSDEYSPKYLFYYLYSLDTSKAIYKMGTGLRQNLSFNDFKRFSLPNISLEYQITVAKFLDQKTLQIDEAIELKKKQIEKLNEYKQIVIQNAVTKGLNPGAKMKDSGIDWMGNIPEHWKIEKLKYVAKNYNYKVSSKDSSLRYLGMENVLPHKGEINDETSEVEGLANHFKAGQVLFGKLRPYLSKVYLADFEGICSTEFMVFETDKNLLPEFLKTIMLSNSFVDNVNSSTYGSKMPRANPDFINNQYIAVPDIKEQANIVNHIKHISSPVREAIEKYEIQIERLKEYKTILINQAVTGKIKVS